MLAGGRAGGPSGGEEAALQGLGEPGRGCWGRVQEPAGAGWGTWHVSGVWKARKGG